MPPSVVVARARDARARSRGAADDDWWMISHGYENGYRTLGRQILLEPIRWSEDDWPEAVVRDLGGAIEAPAGAVGAARRRRTSPTTSRTLVLGERWTFHAPGPRRGRARCASTTASCCGARAPRPPTRRRSRCSPETTRTRSRSTSTVEPGVEAGLLLFFNNRLFCGMGIDGERMLSYSGGIRTHWREPAPATRPHHAAHPQRRAHRHRLVPRARRRVDASRASATRRPATTPTRSGDLLSLRPALYAAGDGRGAVPRLPLPPAACVAPRFVRRSEAQTTRSSTGCVRSSELPDVEAEDAGLDDEPRRAASVVQNPS